MDVTSVLIIHLKRFKANFRKIKTKIEYPINGLDVSKWIEQNVSDSRR